MVLIVPALGRNARPCPSAAISPRIHPPAHAVARSSRRDQGRGVPHRNLAVELPEKVLKGKLRMRGRRNVVRARSFAERLGETIRCYRNRAIEAAQVIEELIEVAKLPPDKAEKATALVLEAEALSAAWAVA
jgi:hypothetical protein